MQPTPNILTEFFMTLERRKNEFTLHTESKKFDIYKHTEIPGLEMALLRDCSEPHYHSVPGYFCFMQDAVLVLGGLDAQGVGHVNSFAATKGVIYPIPAYVLHAAGPKHGDAQVTLLIYAPEGDRPREGDYPDDTFKPMVLG